MSDLFIKEVASNIGNLPIVFYGSYQIDIKDIYFLTLYYNGNMPSIKLSFYDTLNLMIDKGHPLDDSKLKLFINPRSSQLNDILMQFKITSFVIKDSRYILEGVLDINLLYLGQYKSYPNMTSHKVLQQIAKEAGMGFNTNIDDTNDAMTWINPGNDVKDFVEDIVESSYKSDQSFITFFIDFYYNFNLIDLAKELDRNTDTDLSITDGSLSKSLNSQNTETLSKLILSNDESMRETNLFFGEYRIINNSTLVSLDAGYKSTVEYYDEILKEFLIFNIDSITSKSNKSIILKGSPQDNEFFNLNTNTYYVGRLDTDNCHKNFNFSHIQNEKNLYDLEKIGLEIDMNTPNYSIYKYQKIKIFLSNQVTTPSTGLKNERLSGDWLITDIKFVLNNGEFKQSLKLIKRELELSEEELSKEKPIVNNEPKSEITNSNNDTNNIPTTNPVINSSTASNIQNNESSDINSILTKDIFRRIYKGKVNNRVIELMYSPIVSIMEKYGINTKTRICSFISQINTESGFLKAVEEYSSGLQYNNNTNLGNGPNDGPKYKGRGLLQITGRNNYKKAGNFSNKDFINNPNLVSADNKTHIAAADSSEQLNNSVLASVFYWVKGSSWGDLNNYADKIDITKNIDYGVYTYSDLPIDQKDAHSKGFKVKKSNNFATNAKSSNDNLLNFTLICFGVNGGYNGYKERINNWNDIRKYFI